MDLQAALQNDWVGIAALVAALPALVGALVNAYVSVRKARENEARHTAAEEERKECREELSILRRKYNHAMQHLRLIDAIIGRIVPDRVYQQLTRDLGYDKRYPEAADDPDA